MKNIQLLLAPALSNKPDAQHVAKLEVRPMPQRGDHSNGVQKCAKDSSRHLRKRGEIYYFKRRIPAEVVRRLGLAYDQFTQSLKTSDLEEANLRVNDALTRFEALVASTPKGGSDVTRSSKHAPRIKGTTKYLLTEHIPALLSRYEYSHLVTDDEERKVMNKEDRTERLDMLNEGLEVLYEQAASEDYSTAEEVAQLMLENERLIAPPGSAVRERLLRELLAKDIEVMEVQRDRLRGRMTLTPREVPIAPRQLVTLFDLFQSWKKTQTSLRTIEAYESFVQHFERVAGALPVSSITKHHVFQYRDALSGAGLVRETVKNRIGGMSTLVKFGLRVSILPILPILPNPFEGIEYGHIAETPAHETRRAFELSELNKLFSSPVYLGQQRTTGQAADSSYWASLMGPFVGARTEEICQMRVDDVQRVNGHWALRVANLDEAQNLKNDSSYRLIPIHDELVKCGFLAYVDGVKSAGHSLLFPSHRNDNKHKRFGNAFGKWFSAYLSKIDLDDPRLSYHSFRYNFKQQCTICGIEDEVRDALTGHWISKNEGGRIYMSGPERQYPFPALVSAMKKLRYDDLDLSRLYK